jgi:group I intron endonuclease
MKTISGVYILEHTASGKQYIGSSGDITQRLRKHREALRRGKHHSPHLQHAWAKYGAQAFAARVLLRCSVDNLFFYEQCCLDAFSPAFNGSKSASGPVKFGSKLPPEWVAKVAASVRARYAAGFMPVAAGWKYVTAEANSKRALERWADPAKRTQIEASMKKAFNTAEMRATRSENTKKLWAEPLYRERAVASRVGNSFAAGYVCTPEQVENRRRAGHISQAKRAEAKRVKSV